MDNLTKYENIIVILDQDVNRWCDQMVRSLTRAGIGYAEIDLLRCEVSRVLVDRTTDQTMHQQLFCLFSQWATVREKNNEMCY